MNLMKILHEFTLYIRLSLWYHFLRRMNIVQHSQDINRIYKVRILFSRHDGYRKQPLSMYPLKVLKSQTENECSLLLTSMPAGHKALNIATSTFIFKPVREVLQKFS